MSCVLSRHTSLANNTSESHLQAAKSDWECGLFKSMRAAARAYDVSLALAIVLQIWMLSVFQVPYTTLVDRIKGQPSRREAHKSQQLLSPSEETTLCDWVDFHATMAKPLDIQGVQVLASVISGKQPGKNWIGQYKKWNSDLCQLRPGGLDPKWAQNFNPSNVAGIYDLLKAIYDIYPDLPPQHC